MTWRAAILGLLGAVLICGLTYLNDAVMHQTYLVGNNMPLAVYGTLVLAILVLNPLLARFGKRLPLSGPEMAVVLALTLAACCIPGSGLMRTLSCSLVLPYHYARVTPGWTEHHLLERVPEGLLAHVTPANESEVLNGFVQGLSVGGRHIAVSQVPWQAWVAPLLFWLPVVLLLWLALLGLSLVVHRQWAEHEQLPYPIARFAHALLPGTGQVVSEVLRSRLFQLGLIAVLVIHLNNYACKWFPSMLSIPLSVDLQSLSQFFPALARGGGGWWVWSPHVYFTVIAFAFFLPSETGLALGIAPVLYCWLAGVLAGYGIAVEGGLVFAPTITNFFCIGAYLGFTGVLLYSGRRYYLDVARSAITVHAVADVPRLATWGARIFLLSLVLFTVLLAGPGGMDWPIAVIFAACVVMIYLVLSRIVAETGAFFVQPSFYPMSLFLGVLGASAFGPQAVLIVGLFTAILVIDPREAFMPFMVNSLKILDSSRVRLGRMAMLTVGALLIGLLVAVPVTLYLQYDRGMNTLDGWSTNTAPRLPFVSAEQAEQELAAQGRLVEAGKVSGLGHFRNMTPSPKAMLALGIGLGLVVLFTAARLRFPKWPLHPVMFLVCSSYPMFCFSASFLVGWLIKALTMRFGGVLVYRRLVPLMIGLIAGEMIAGVLITAIGALYYFMAGRPPQVFSIMPG